MGKLGEERGAQGVGAPLSKILDPISSCFRASHVPMKKEPRGFFQFESQNLKMPK